MNCESSIENTNNLDKQSHHSSDEVSSTGGSSGCDSDGEISWSSEAEINYQRSNYALRSLQVEKIDKNDTSANDDVENDDQELSLWNSDSIRDSELTSDSDEEFAIHPCLQGLIKSKSVSSIQKNDYTTFTLCNEKKLVNDDKSFTTNNEKCPGDQFANTQSLSEEETSASSVPYFSRSRIVRDYRASVCKTRSNARVSDNWSAPGNNTFKDGIGFESDDDLDQARSSPFTCCWSAPEFIGDNEQETSEELSSSEDASFVAGNLLSEKSQHASVPCADLSEYDEPMRTSILDFSGPASMQIDDLPRPNPRYQKSCPRAISENDSLCIYDASPSLHGDDDDDEMDFVDELPEIEHTKINKWTPEGLINFAKETFRESTEANEQLLENRPKISNISKSLGSLDLWETEMGWITRVPSPVDNIRMALRQSISCHDHMITSYVDCVIQNHYNRCSSPGCRKYASKPEIMKQSMNSGSDTSDDEWIRCVDEITALEESFGNDHIRREVYDQVTASLLSQRNDSNLYATYQHISDLYTDSSREIDKTKMECEEEDVIVKRPIKLLIELEKLTDDEMITIEDDHCNDECLSYREKNQYSSTTDQHTKRSYSLNNLQQLSETLVDSGKELFLFKTKISDMEVEQHFVEIRNLSKFDQHDTYYSNIYHSKLNTEYGSDESDENYDNDNDNDNGSDAFVDRILPVKTNKLPNFYEFTFDVKKSNSNEIKKLPSLHPFGDNNNKSDLGEQILDASYSTVTLWDDCCEYAQQINEIARIWLQKPINDSNTEELISDQAAAAALTICPKSGDLAKLTLETVELDKRRLPLSPPPINGYGKVAKFYFES
uniref:Uncharacterized protein n=1 Tax=Setaria digitata TaxID=48799 RepID=A0A915PUE1_9BILA